MTHPFYFKKQTPSPDLFKHIVLSLITIQELALLILMMSSIEFDKSHFSFKSSHHHQKSKTLIWEF